MFKSLNSVNSVINSSEFFKGLNDPNGIPNEKIVCFKNLNDLNDEKMKTTKFKKARCSHCNKSMGLLKFKCKCEKTHCINCKVPEIHNCNFDYKECHKNFIIKENPEIVSQKIIKI
jgi:hypothetical protein